MSRDARRRSRELAAARSTPATAPRRPCEILEDLRLAIAGLALEGGAGQMFKRIAAEKILDELAAGGALADALVADLFRNGAGLEGERLAIVAGGIDHGGWSRVGFRDRVIKILRGEARS